MTGFGVRQMGYWSGLVTISNAPEGPVGGGAPATVRPARCVRALTAKCNFVEAVLGHVFFAFGSAAAPRAGCRTGELWLGGGAGRPELAAGQAPRSQR